VSQISSHAVHVTP